MSIAEDRRKLVASTVAAIRDIEAGQGVTADALAAIKAELIKLASHAELFPAADFPPPERDGEDKTALYCLAEDDDHRFALYLQACNPGLDVPPHNHTTWAAIVGLNGIEENRFYARDPKDPAAPPQETGRREVTRGDGVAFLPDELHSIHIHGDAPVINFHMYGYALDRLDARDYWSARAGAWKIFPAQEGIIDRRAG